MYLILRTGNLPVMMLQYPQENLLPGPVLTLTLMNKTLQIKYSLEQRRYDYRRTAFDYSLCVHSDIAIASYKISVV